MQRFLIFILIVIAGCIALTRIFITDLEPVEFTAANDAVQLGFQKPVFNEGKLLLDMSWNQMQLVYLCKILILVVIVLVAVLNYRNFISEPSDIEEN